MEKKALDLSELRKCYIQLNTGITMPYCECGPAAGKTVLLIHGVTDGMVSWAQVVPFLTEKGYHCYIVAYRGNVPADDPCDGENGYTAELIAEDLADFIRIKKLRSVHVVGHSYGSLICQMLALKAQQQCSSYTLIDSAVDCRENPALLWVRDGDGKNYFGVNAYSNGLPESFLKIWTATTNEAETFRRGIYDHTKQISLASWKNLINGLLCFNNDQGIRQIKGNVLVLWGTADDIFTRADQMQLKEGLVSCIPCFIDVKGASHNGFWDSLKMAEKYANYIHEFIRTVPEETTF